MHQIFPHLLYTVLSRPGIQRYRQPYIRVPLYHGLVLAGHQHIDTGAGRDHVGGTVKHPLIFTAVQPFQRPVQLHA